MFWLVLTVGLVAGSPAGLDQVGQAQSEKGAVLGNRSEQDAELGKLFSERGIQGTLAIESLSGDRLYLHNPERAKVRYCPASTFKIPNTLFAVDSGVIADKDEKWKWDGKAHSIADWNKDHSLATAFPVSCVWFFQEIARRLGADKYKTYLKECDYGNQVIGDDVTTFWLDDTLKISALEQIVFLRKVIKRQLPIKPSAYEILGKVMVAQPEGDCAIWAKTGWAIRTDSQVGWYVGYAVAGKETWLFAINIDMGKQDDARFRQELVRLALRAKGICKN